jgi:hypothetical protein
MPILYINSAQGKDFLINTLNKLTYRSIYNRILQNRKYFVAAGQAKPQILVIGSNGSIFNPQLTAVYSAGRQHFSSNQL